MAGQAGSGASVLRDADLLETFSHFLATDEVLRLSLVARDLHATLTAAFNREKPLRFWSRKEGATRHGAPLSLVSETCWADAFTIPPAREPEAPDAAAPDAGGDGDAAMPDAAPQPDPDASAQLQLPAAAARLCRELPPPPALIELALNEALPDIMGPITAAAVTAALSSPAWPQAAQGFWATAFMGIVLSGGGPGVNRLLAWLWKHSVPSAIGVTEAPGYGASSATAGSAPSQYQQQHQQPRSPLLTRYHVREFAAAVLVLLRHKAVTRTQLHGALPAAHDALCCELLHLEALDLHSAVRTMQSVPQWRLDGLPLPARNVALPGGNLLTAEQISIIQNVVPFEVFGNGTIHYQKTMPNVTHRVQAFAGCGKTSTLRAIAEAHSGLSFLYVAFNKSVADGASASFPKANTECRTSHSLAYGAHGKGLKEKLKLPWTSTHIQNAVRNTAYNGTDKKFALDAAECVKGTLDRFMTSADDAVADRHVPATRPRYSDPSKAHDWVALAQHLWRRMCNAVDRSMAATHNTYLKLFQLDGPVLLNKNGKPFDVILIDEAQDLNDLTVQLLLSQPGTKVLVGDRNQHIYSFNGCSNALERQFEGGRTFQLSISFRMGPEVNALVNRILRTAKHERRLVLGRGSAASVVYVPADQHPSRVAHNHKPITPPTSFEQVPLLGFDTMEAAGTPVTLEAGPLGIARLPPAGPGAARRQLCYVTRSNAAWLRVAIALAQEGTSFYLTACEGGNSVPLFDDIDHLHRFRYQNRTGKFREWASSWQELKISPRAKSEGMRSAILIVEQYGASVMEKIALVMRHKVAKRQAAAYILTTAHKMKGLEEEYVQLADDFLTIAGGRVEEVLAQEAALEAAFIAALPPAEQPLLQQQQQQPDVEEDEYNLVYVAASRALKVLICNRDLAMLVFKMMAVNEHVQARSRHRLRLLLRTEQQLQGQMNALVQLVLNDFQAPPVANEAEEAQLDLQLNQAQQAMMMVQQMMPQLIEMHQGQQAQQQQLLLEEEEEDVDINLEEQDQQQQQPAPAAAAAPAQQAQQQQPPPEIEIERPETHTFTCSRCKGRFIPVEAAALDVLGDAGLLCEACVGRSMYCSLWGLPPARQGVRGL